MAQTTHRPSLSPFVTVRHADVFPATIGSAGGHQVDGQRRGLNQLGSVMPLPPRSKGS